MRFKQLILAAAVILALPVKAEIGARLRPLSVALDGLPFRPVVLAGTPLSGLPSLGGMTEDVGDTGSPLPQVRPGPRRTMPTVEVKASKRIAELPYRDYVEIQQQLQAYLPPGPQLVDLWFRIGLAGKSESERDAHLPQSLAVSVYSESVDAAVLVRRGAYFSLPQIQQAYDERGQILLTDVERPWLGIWWTMRVPEGQRMTYGDVRDARAQIGGVQARISSRFPRLKSVKREPYDGIKACFHDASGVILVDGKATADAAEGLCKVLFDSSALERGASIEFSGPLDVVSFIDRRYYPSR